jgi:hypothetical protein
MSRLAVSFSVVVLMLAVMACGGSDRPATPESATAPPVSSQGTGAAPAAPAAPAPVAVEPETDPQAESCLSLVGQAKFQEALPVCTAALRNNPGNQQVQGALDQAKAETAKMAAASALGETPGAAEAAGAAQAGAEAAGAAGAGAEAVEGGAASQVEGTTGGVKLPE